MRAPPRGNTLIGLLVAMAIMVVLAFVAMNAMNKAVTGSGSAAPGTVRSFKDVQYLSSLFMSMAAASQLEDEGFLVPGDLGGGHDPASNTTANLYSAMIAQSYTVPGQLISGNEYNPSVWPDSDYDYTSYDARRGTWWDAGFKADLAVESNTSFAHVPLYGQRLRQLWRFTAGSHTPLLGNRGPEGGLDNPNSYTYGRSGVWGGHVVFGDGHVEFLTTFTPAGVVYGRGAERLPDNIFDAEEGPDGLDAILTFTKAMTAEGPEVQWD
jgi:hypothetical protein